MPIDKAIEFIFKPINYITEIQRMNQWRQPRKEVKPYLQIIKYRIENNCSEYEPLVVNCFSAAGGFFEDIKNNNELQDYINELL